jgi:hypothetical protein
LLQEGESFLHAAEERGYSGEFLEVRHIFEKPSEAPKGGKRKNVPPYGSGGTLGIDAQVPMER